MQPGSTFQLIAEWRVAGTDEMVPHTDVLTAFEITNDGTVVQIRTEVGALDLEVEDYVDVVAPPA